MLAGAMHTKRKGKALERLRFGAQLAQALIEIKGGANICRIWQYNGFMAVVL